MSSRSWASTSRRPPSPRCFAKAAWVRRPAGSDRPGRSSSGCRRTASSPPAPRPKRARASRSSWRSRNGRGRSPSATVPPPLTPMPTPTNPSLTPRRVRRDSSSRRWALCRMHPQHEFHRALELALATVPRWPPESLCEREGGNLRLVFPHPCFCVSTRAGIEDQMTIRSRARRTTRDSSQPLQISDPIEFLYGDDVAGGFCSPA